MIYDDIIDEEFLDLLKSKVDDIKSISQNRFKKQLETLLRVGAFIDGLKPRSKFRSYKKDMIEFLDHVKDHPDMDKDDYTQITQEKLSGLFSFLQVKYSFMYRDDWFWRGAFNLALDLFLFFIGLSKFYYYIPVFTIVSVVRNLNKIKKAEKAGKIIDF